MAPAKSHLSALASAGATAPTPPFRPTPSDPSSSSIWTPLLTSPCHFPRSIFLSTLKDLCLHPERNSSLILRADSLPPRAITPGDTPAGLTPVEEVRVRLMPRQPNRDGRLAQRCLFFRGDADPATGKQEEGAVLYLPEVRAKGELPFYYPPVRGLRYSWEAVEPDLDTALEGLDLDSEEKERGKEEGEPTAPPVVGRISIAYLPWPDDPPPTSTDPIATPPPPRSSLSPTRTLPKRRSPLSAPPVSVTDDGDLRNTSGTTAPVAPAATIIAPASPDSPAENSRKSHERVLRISRVLLETVYKHGFGHMVGYKKRMHHDVIVPRDSFQDLYLVLKDRHRHLDSRAPKPGSTNTRIEDVKRHVFKVCPLPLTLHIPLPYTYLFCLSFSSLSNEAYKPTNKDIGLPDDPLLQSPASPSFAHLCDSHPNSTVDLSEWGEQDVAIAAFLMLLWKEEYPPNEPMSSGSGQEWDTWGRPPGGFVDLGCGNGLLVHILTAEGYSGKGLELRKRRTWPAYPPETQANLVELAIDFPAWFPSTVEEWESGTWAGREDCPIREGVFIVGNHSDEITPWIPLLSLLPPTPVPFLSLPCCAHTLDAPFTPTAFAPPPHPHSPSTGFDDGLEAGQSRYKAYLMWLGWVGLQCGWEWEKEGLRIPSTRGWGIVGRKRWAKTPEELRECREWALGQVDEVRTRGAFKVRIKEGNDH